MRKIIVDTNIIFSCLLNTQGTIGDLIFNSNDIFEFYSNEYMRYEIRKHWAKIKKISKLTDLQLETSYDKLLTKLTFINEGLIPKIIWRKSEVLVADIDEDDIDFVALTKYLKGSLWTGDKILYSALKAKRFRTVYNTAELVKLRDKVAEK
ncbi:PIN domain-containing protein [Larkinella terrae]|uniref:Nucleotide-binding protein n=1 Tax=Larkinella terrae TaxID=2025311 RepID=A0A7K0EE06_9BACT|nr:PIN domain-containing protein [Larkinella terrae]MRS60080.1 nucleotide-binding protein [Larkinella terrae]